MNRGNVFKLSGNMALGSENNVNSYSGGNSNIEEIKNSLRLLKAKQKQKNPNIIPQDYEPQYKYEEYPPVKHKTLIRNKQPSSYNYEFNAKNHIPQQTYAQPITNNNRKPQSYSESNKRISKKNNNNDHDYDNIYQKPIEQNYGQNNKNDYNKGIRRPKDQPVFEEKKYNASRNSDSYLDQMQFKSADRKSNKPSIEEQPIREVNKQNRVDIIQYDPSQFILCKAGCGRKFNPNSIKKHEANCKKVFQKKRKQFNSQQNRIIAHQQKKLMKRGEIIDSKLQKAKINQKIPKWKAESIALRVGLKSISHKPISNQEQQLLDQVKDQGMIKCHVCGRTFNEKAGIRHVQFCQAQKKKIVMKIKK